MCAWYVSFSSSWLFCSSLLVLRAPVCVVGTVERADVNEGRDGRPSGSGIVKFARAADAAKAISKFDGADFDGRIIYVKYDEKA
jgi:RNA recognition motif-containing protein